MTTPRGIVLPPATALALRGGATQFRVPCKPQPDHLQIYDWKGVRVYEGEHRLWCYRGQTFENLINFPDGEDRRALAAMAPHQPGTFVFVKEALRWSRNAGQFTHGIQHPDEPPDLVYAVDGTELRDVPDDYTPRIEWHGRGVNISANRMPAWAARTWLTVQDVTVERHDGVWYWCYTAARTEKPVNPLCYCKTVESATNQAERWRVFPNEAGAKVEVAVKKEDK